MFHAAAEQFKHYWGESYFISLGGNYKDLDKFFQEKISFLEETLSYHATWQLKCLKAVNAVNVIPSKTLCKITLTMHDKIQIKFPVKGHVCEQQYNPIIIQSNT